MLSARIHFFRFGLGDIQRNVRNAEFSGFGTADVRSLQGNQGLRSVGEARGVQSLRGSEPSLGIDVPSLHALCELRRLGTLPVFRENFRTQGA